MLPVPCCTTGITSITGFKNPYFKGHTFVTPRLSPSASSACPSSCEITSRISETEDLFSFLNVSPRVHSQLVLTMLWDMLCHLCQKIQRFKDLKVSLRSRFLIHVALNWECVTHSLSRAIRDLAIISYIHHSVQRKRTTNNVLDQSHHSLLVTSRYSDIGIHGKTGVLPLLHRIDIVISEQAFLLQKCKHLLFPPLPKPLISYHINLTKRSQLQKNAFQN